MPLRQRAGPPAITHNNPFFQPAQQFNFIYFLLQRKTFIEFVLLKEKDLLRKTFHTKPLIHELHKIIQTNKLKLK